MDVSVGALHSFLAEIINYVFWLLLARDYGKEEEKRLSHVTILDVYNFYNAKSVT